MADPVNINVGNNEIDALARLVEAEANVVKAFYSGASVGAPDNLSKKFAYEPIIDTVLNRVSAQSWYGSDIQGVINKPGQYSPNTTGGLARYA